MKIFTYFVFFHEASGFLWSGNKLNVPLPDLQKQAKDREETVLDVNFQLGQKNEPKFSLKGLVMELGDMRPDFKHPQLPGITGLFPKTSSGPRTINVKNLPFFIGMDGKKEVKMLNGIWEMVWRDGSPNGSICCGFEVPEGAQRNDAKLQAGTIYLNLPLWTKDGLLESQQRERERELRASKYMEKVKEEVDKVQATSNPFTKAIHFRNAAAAREKYDLNFSTKKSDIPTDENVILLDENILLSKIGTVWMKVKGYPATLNYLGETVIRLNPESIKA